MVEYKTKDSGVRAEYESGMVRDTQDGKPNFALTAPLGQPYEDQMLTRWAALMTRGAEKYGERNWEQADSDEEYRRFMASAWRHFMQWFFGEEDEDHAAAVFFNIAAAEYVKQRMAGGPTVSAPEGTWMGTPIAELRERLAPYATRADADL